MVDKAARTAWPDAHAEDGKNVVMVVVDEPANRTAQGEAAAERLGNFLAAAEQ